MAKKNFKSGLDSLLEETIKKQASEVLNKNSNNSETKNTEKTGTESLQEPQPENFTEQLKMVNENMEKLKFELKLWRTGKLTLSLFQKALDEKNLRFDEKLNKIVAK